MTPAESDRAARHAALTLAAGLPSDTVLYLLLPLNVAEFGVTLPEAGVLLAANRLVRIAGYGQVAGFYARRGPRAACTLAAGAAVLAAFGYAILSGLWGLLVARLLWGLAFAALNIANQALPTAVREGASLRSGRARAIVAAASVLGLIGGSWVAQAFGPRATFCVLGTLALGGLWAARGLPDTPDGPTPGGPRFALPSRLDVYGFVQGLTLDGLFGFGFALLAAASLPQGAALAVGSVLAIRYAAEIVLGPPGGRLADRFGAAPMLWLLSSGAALGLLGMGLGWLWTGAALVIVLRGALQPLSGPAVAAANPGPARVPALARQATWRDIGAGTGPLLAGTLAGVAAPWALYGTAALALALAGWSVRRP